jgi:hypothetical protein
MTLIASSNSYLAKIQRNQRVFLFLEKESRSTTVTQFWLTLPLLITICFKNVREFKKKRPNKINKKAPLTIFNLPQNISRPFQLKISNVLIRTICSENLPKTRPQTLERERPSSSLRPRTPKKTNLSKILLSRPTCP